MRPSSSREPLQQSERERETPLLLHPLSHSTLSSALSNICLTCFTPARGSREDARLARLMSIHSVSARKKERSHSRTGKADHSPLDQWPRATLLTPPFTFSTGHTGHSVCRTPLLLSRRTVSERKETPALLTSLHEESLTNSPHLLSMSSAVERVRDERRKGVNGCGEKSTVVSGSVHTHTLKQLRRTNCSNRTNLELWRDTRPTLRV